MCNINHNIIFYSMLKLAKRLQRKLEVVVSYVIISSNSSKLVIFSLIGLAVTLSACRLEDEDL